LANGTFNSVFLSPHFPPNFKNFVVRLRECGANVFGIADEHYELLSPELRHNLTEYYRVSDMHNYDELRNAINYFRERHGEINHLDSQNEYWLQTEAQLRTEFNIPGIANTEIDRIKRKSEMKRVFQSAGLKVARGRICTTEHEIRDFIKEVGFPVVAKPDIGVGAESTYKISNEDELRNYFETKHPADYIVEEFIDWQIVSYDGLVDAEGKLVFSSSLRYDKGVMEAVNDNSDIFYYIVRSIEPNVEQAGLATLKAFDLRARFFHFEFFQNERGEVMPLEVNMRPPGGLTLDMFNYMCDCDCYKTWAEMIVNNKYDAFPGRKYFVIYVGRKDGIHYSVPHAEVLDRFRSLIVHHEPINSIFAPAIGNYGYLLRSPELAPIVEAARSIHRRVEL
jgi:hypothetical protein